MLSLAKRLLWLVAFGACTGGGAAVPRPLALSFSPDTSSVVTLRAGIVKRFIYARTGPWAIHVLEVDLNGCNQAIALKGEGGAVGREKTSVLLQQLASRYRVVGGVNADFF